MTAIDLDPALKQLFGSVPPQRELIKLKGDASTRSYYRLRLAADLSRAPDTDPSSLIVMHLPEDYLRSDEIVTGPAPTELPFLNLQRFLDKRGVPVPKVLVIDLARRLVLLEDLGDETLRSRLLTRDPSAWPAIYRQAVGLLAQLHTTCARGEPGCIAFERSFDSNLVYQELDHFRQYGLEAVYGTLAARDREALERGYQYVVRAIEAMPKGFVHRDYQSRNLMYAPRRGGEALVVIDFQDALIGPKPYDLASLLCDSYVDLEPALQESLIAHYLSVARLGDDESAAFTRGFWLVVLQRKLKDAGRFVFIDRVRGNRSFLRSYPASLRYVGRALDRVAGLDGLKELLQRLIPGFPKQVPEPPACSG